MTVDDNWKAVRLYSEGSGTTKMTKRKEKVKLCKVSISRRARPVNMHTWG